MKLFTWFFSLIFLTAIIATCTTTNNYIPLLVVGIIVGFCYLIGYLDNKEKLETEKQKLETEKQHKTNLERIQKIMRGDFDNEIIEIEIQKENDRIEKQKKQLIMLKEKLDNKEITQEIFDNIKQRLRL